jgi:cupin superfamily acireductone dioxygenase involved in methionine salvage
MTDYNPEEIYENFWKDIVEVDGVLDMDQLKKELADFHMVIHEVPSVYSHITDGAMSKATYRASDVISVAEEVEEKHIQEAIEDFLQEWGLPDPREGNGWYAEEEVEE